MEDLVAAARVLVALTFYATAYVLPLTLIVAALIRMALRWHSSWRLIIAATMAALPQAFMLLLAKTEPKWALYSLTALSGVALVLYFLAIRQHRDAKILLEIFLFVAALVYIVMNVNWIVG
jgi:hypothetical protein